MMNDEEILEIYDKLIAESLVDYNVYKRRIPSEGFNI